MTVFSLESKSGDLVFTFSGYDRGRRPLQWSLCSGRTIGHEPLCMSSLTSELMRVRGRTRVYNSKGLVGEKEFEVSITDSQNVSIVKKTSGLHPSDTDLEPHFVAKESLVIMASNLRESTKSPLETLSFQIVVGDIATESGGLKSAFFCRGHIHAAESTPPPPGEDITVEHVLDNIVFLSADINIGDALEHALELQCVVDAEKKASKEESTEPEPEAAGRVVRKPLSGAADSYNPSVHSIATLSIFVTTATLISPLGARVNDIPLLGPLRYVILYILGTIAFQILLFLVVFLAILLIVITPKRRDYPQQWLSRAFRILARPVNGGDQGSYKTDGKLSMFVNGWNAWSFCGSVLKGKLFPLYGMPHKFVKAFHDGGPALGINLGRTENTVRDYIASDMFTVIADIVHRRGIVCGFLSQKKQFGCISANKAYDHITVHIACDGTVISPRVPAPADKIPDTSGEAGSQPHIVKTDWFFIELQEKLVTDPLGTYLELSGLYNRVPDLFASVDSPLAAVGAAGASVSTPSGVSSSTTSLRRRKSSSPHSNKMPQTGTGAEQGDNDGGYYYFEDKGYLAARGKDAHSRRSYVLNEIPAGWCSWYHFFEKVSEADLEKNIESMIAIADEHGLGQARQGFSLFQIDDGYQRAWGDWLLLDEKKFPKQSMRYLVDRIGEARMRPGLWMAPFACDKHSKIAEKHKDWILKKDDTDGIPANSANCGKWFYGLDVTNPEVRRRVHQCIRTATEKWGFQYLKLDFLYAAALGRSHESFHDRTLTRAQAMQVGMHTITEAMGDSVFLLGCGAPMGSVIGHVHANRVSADAGLSWYPPFPLPAHDKWNLPCARNMVRNSICRMTMHGRWWINDPDCMLLRTSTAFSEEEIVGIATVKALSGGSFIISDDLNTVPAKRMRIAQQLLPATNKAAVPLDLLDQEMPEVLRLSLGDKEGAVIEPWTVLGVCNWDDFTKRKSITVEETGLLNLLALRLKKQPKAVQAVSAAAATADDGSPTASLLPMSVFSFIFPSTPTRAGASKEPSKTATLATSVPVPTPHSSVLLHSYEFWTGTYTYHIIPLGTEAATASAPANLNLAPASVSKTFATAVVRSPSASDFITPKRSAPLSAADEDSHFSTPSTTNTTATADFTSGAKSKNSTVTDINSITIGKLPKIKPHSALLYSLRPLTFVAVRPTARSLPTSQPHYVCEPQYLGSNLHFSCGLEVKGFSYSLTDSSYGSLMAADQSSRSIPSSPAKTAATLVETGVPAAPLSVRSRNIQDQSSSLTITFHEGAVRGSEWGGYIVVFLPLYPEAIPDGAEPYVSKDIHEQIAIDIEGSACKQQLPTLIALIDEPQCGAKGSVWKVYLRAAGASENTLIIRW